MVFLPGTSFAVKPHSLYCKESNILTHPVAGASLDALHYIEQIHVEHGKDMVMGSSDSDSNAFLLRTVLESHSEAVQA
jgi:hypothetical protein